MCQSWCPFSWMVLRKTGISVTKDMMTNQYIGLDGNCYTSMVTFSMMKDFMAVVLLLQDEVKIISLFTYFRVTRYGVNFEIYIWIDITLIEKRRRCVITDNTIQNVLIEKWLHTKPHSRTCPMELRLLCIKPSIWLWILMSFSYTLSHGYEIDIHGCYPSLGCENQWIWPVAENAVDTTDPNFNIGYHTLIYISVAQGVYIHGIYAISGDSRFLLMPNVNGMRRLYIYIFITLFYWLNYAICAK